MSAVFSCVSYNCFFLVLNKIAGRIFCNLSTTEYVQYVFLQPFPQVHPVPALNKPLTFSNFMAQF